jgi:glycosyltransferase involved in cell wall biosynthesis
MLSFIPGAVLKAWPFMVSQRPDVLYSTAPPYSCHITALCLKSLFGVPWLADFRDPWADNPFRNDNPYPSLHTLNRYLEKQVIEKADLVVSNTPALEAEFRRRYPHLDRFYTIHNGFDPELLHRFKDNSCSGDEQKKQGLHMVHTGEVYGLRSPRCLISALGEIRNQDPELFGSIRVEFYGKVHEKNELKELAHSLRVQEALFFGGQVDHGNALERAAGADILLVLGVMGFRPEVQVPSKLFEYLALKKPIISLSKKGGAIHEILKESGAPYLLADLEDGGEIKTAIERAAQGDFEGGGEESNAEAYAFDRLALRLAELMDGLKSGRK